MYGVGNALSKCYNICKLEIFYFITLYNVQTDRIGSFVVRCLASSAVAFSTSHMHSLKAAKTALAGLHWLLG